jgi:PAS domain S-box-containing protein
MKDKTILSEADLLRQKAEEMIKNRLEKIEDTNFEGNILKLIHELDVHQIELEMQHHELLTAKTQAEIEAEKYKNLYDFAPSGYITVTKEGEIVHLNFEAANLLGKERSKLIKNRFGFFITDESKKIFSSFIDHISESKTKETCEVSILNDNGLIYAYLTGTMDENEQYCLLTIVNISKRKIAEEEVRKSRSLLYSLIDSQKGTIIYSIDTNYRVINFNKFAAEAMKYAYGTEIEEGKNIMDCYSSKEDKIEAKENYDRALKGETYSKIKIYGEVNLSYYEIFFNPILYNNNIIGATCLSLDITDRIVQEEALKASEEKYRNIFESNNDSITLYKLNGDNKPSNFIEANSASKEIFGYSKSDLLTLSVKDIEPITERKRKARTETLLAEGHIDFETFIKTKRGSKREVETKSILIQFKGEPAVMNITRDITERKQIENNLRRAHESLATIFDAIPDILFEVGLDGCIYHFHSHEPEMLAVSSEYFMGKKFQDILPPDASGIIMSAVLEAKEKGKSKGKQYSLDLKNGLYWFELSVSIINGSDEKDPHFILLAHNITERKKTEIALKLNQQKLNGIFELANSGIMLTDNKGSILMVNDWWYEELGYNEEDFKNLSTFDITVGADLEMSQKWSAKLFDGKVEKYQIEKRFKRKDNSILWAEISVSGIKDENNKVVKAIGIVIDITERKKAIEELIIEKEHAEQSDRLKSAFLANMSHEIRTPMNGILGFTELLKDPKLGEAEQKQYIEIIERSGDRMLNIINDLINISKVESGQMEISIGETNINSQLDYLYTFFKPEATKKGLHLEVKNQLNLKDSIIKTDREKIYAILTNLVKNAIKFTNAGSIEFGYIVKGKFMEFYIKDTGKGIPKNKKELVFERFRQAHESNAVGNNEGSGLGLTISKAYVEMLGGKIWLESEEGKGSTFYFTIPYIPCNEEKKKTDKIEVASKEKAEDPINKLKILIVEDDAISKLLMTIAVKKYAKEVLKVSTGYQAIETCRATPDIDLVMMDINMPEMGGYEATRKIREFNKTVVIIAQTANGMQSDKEQALAAGCNDYISKPVNLNTLGEIIQKNFN